MRVARSGGAGRSVAASVLVIAAVAGRSGDGAASIGGHGSGGDPGIGAVLGGLVLLVLAVYSGYRTYRPLRTLVSMLRGPWADPSEVSAGRTWVSGTVDRAGQTLEAPITGTECVAYTVGGELLDVGYRRRSWEDVAGETAVAPFHVTDGVGHVLVTPTTLGAAPGDGSLDAAEVGTVRREMAVDWDEGGYDPDEDAFDLERDVEVYLEPDEAIPDELADAIAGAGGLTPPGEERGQPVRYREWTLEPGAEVHVLGTVPDAAASPPLVTDDGRFLVSETPPAATARKLLSFASHNAAALLLVLTPFALIAGGHFLRSPLAPFWIVGGLLLGFVCLEGAALAGRSGAFSPGEYRRRRARRLLVAGTVGLAVAVVAIVGPAAAVVGPDRTGWALTAILETVPIVAAVTFGFVAAVVGAVTYGVLAVLGWPSDD